METQEDYLARILVARLNVQKMSGSCARIWCVAAIRAVKSVVTILKIYFELIQIVPFN